MRSDPVAIANAGQASGPAGSEAVKKSACWSSCRLLVNAERVGRERHGRESCRPVFTSEMSSERPWGVLHAGTLMTDRSCDLHPEARVRLGTVPRGPTVACSKHEIGRS